MGVGVCSNRNSLVSVVFQRQRLMPAILRKDLTTVSHLIASFKGTKPCSLYSMLHVPYYAREIPNQQKMRFNYIIITFGKDRVSYHTCKSIILFLRSDQYLTKFA